MKIIEGILATSHIDSHGDMMAPEALESLVEQINTRYIPMGIEHDPRIPPHGRLISAKLVSLEDGAIAVHGRGQVFEKGDAVEFKGEDRVIPLLGQKDMPLHIVFDRSYFDGDSQKLIAQASDILGSKPKMEIKKALAPLSVLTLAGSFILGGIAVGFLNKIGSDFADALKAHIKKLFHKPQRATEQIFCFKAYIEHAGAIIEVEVVMTNPFDSDIDSFLTDGLARLDEVVPLYLDPEVHLRRIVFEYKGKELIVSFGVRADAVPLYPKPISEVENGKAKPSLAVCVLPVASKTKMKRIG